MCSMAAIGLLLALGACNSDVGKTLPVATPTSAAGTSNPASDANRLRNPVYAAPKNVIFQMSQITGVLERSGSCVTIRMGETRFLLVLPDMMQARIEGDSFLFGTNQFAVGSRVSASGSERGSQQLNAYAPQIPENCPHEAIWTVPPDGLSRAS